jgi:hypothetical protein
MSDNNRIDIPAFSPAFFADTRMKYSLPGMRSDTTNCMMCAWRIVEGKAALAPSNDPITVSSSS